MIIVDKPLTTNESNHVFVLAACSLGLAIWAWSLTPQRFEQISLSPDGIKTSEEIQKINNYTEIESLRVHARQLVWNIDEEAYARDMVTAKTMMILGVIVLITVVILILLFLEIAARGRSYQAN